MKICSFVDSAALLHTSVRRARARHSKAVLVLTLAALSGCANMPNPMRTVEVHQPLTARPALPGFLVASWSMLNV